MDVVASIIIRNLDEVVAERLRLQARLHGVSVEEEPRRLRREEMSSAQVEQAVARLLAVGIQVPPSAPRLTRSVRMALDLARSPYDCVYLALAAHYGARLATADGRLRRSAERVAVQLWRSSDLTP